jgi:hypothetical protein
MPYEYINNVTLDISSSKMYISLKHNVWLDCIPVELSYAWTNGQHQKDKKDREIEFSSDSKVIKNREEKDVKEEVL